MSYARFDDEADYRAALAQVMTMAERELCILDHNLVGMNIGSTAGQRLLLSFLKRQPPGRVRIALHDTVPITTAMPRLLELIRDFAHAIAVRQIPDEYRHLADCHLLADGRHGVRRFHGDQLRGSLLLDNPGEVRPWWARFDELWDQSQPINLTGTTGL